MIIWPAKDPAETLDFTWTVPVDGDDTVASHTAAVLSGTATLDDDEHADASVTVWASGGAADELSYFNLTAVTAGGRTFREVAVLPVIDRAAELLAIFRLRYPAFLGTDDGQISYWLADAGALVGEEWPASSRDTGRTAYAAHKLAESATGAIPAGVTSFKSGTFSATVSDSIASLKGLETSAYGREFLALRRAYFGGPMLSWTPPAADYHA